MRILSFDVGVVNLSYCILDINDDKINNFISEMKSIKKKDYNKDHSENAVHLVGISDWKVVNITGDFIKCQQNTLNGECINQAIYNSAENIKICEEHYLRGSKELPRDKKKCKDVYLTSQMLYRHLDRLFKDELFDYVLIENQPVMKNANMKTVQILIYSYFVYRNTLEKSLNSELKFVSAQNKLKPFSIILEQNIKKLKYSEKKKRAKSDTEYFLNNIYKNTNWIQYYNKYRKKDDLADSLLQGIFYYLKNIVRII